MLRRSVSDPCAAGIRQLDRERSDTAVFSPAGVPKSREASVLVTKAQAPFASAVPEAPSGRP